MKAVAQKIDPKGLRWDPIERRVRCMEHSIHVGGGHFIRGVGPTSSRNCRKKGKAAANPSGMDSDGGGASGDEDDTGNANDDGVAEFDAGDTVGKALALVTQVSGTCTFACIALTLYRQIRKSPQARAFFRQVCDDVNIPRLELKLWVRTRWASLYDFLDRMIKLRLAVNRFTRDADDSPDVPILKKKLYSEYRLMTSDWDKMQLMHEVLQV
jgi:hypothetical protein